MSQHVFRSTVTRALTVVLTALGSTACTDVAQRFEPAPDPALERNGWGEIESVDTLFYEVEVERIRLPALSKRGGIAPLGSGLAFVAQKGAVYFMPELKWSSGREAAQFATVPFPWQHQLFTKFETSHVSVFDVATRAVAGNPDDSGVASRSLYEIFVSHIDLDEDESCVFLALSVLTVSLDEHESVGVSDAWRTIFESQPCISVSELSRGSLIQTGGRMAIDGDTLYLTVGQMQLSDLRNEPVSRDTSLDYGKVFAVDLTTGEAVIHTLGHRNPQGLYLDEAGKLWSTEHGPDGGDEVNLLKRGADYGFPTVTLGTDMRKRIWSTSDTQNSHAGFEAPIFAFTPSIGVSQIMRMERAGEFPVWTGDLLVGSLSDQSLYRLHLEDGRVVTAERIFVEERVRDMMPLDDGRIVILTDSNQMLLLTSRDP